MQFIIASVHSTTMYSTVRVKQRVARVHLRQLIAVFLRTKQLSSDTKQRKHRFYSLGTRAKFRAIY